MPSETETERAIKRVRKDTEAYIKPYRLDVLELLAEYDRLKAELARLRQENVDLKEELDMWAKSMPDRL